MKKIPTLFVREFENHNVVKCTQEVTPGLEWLFTDSEVIPTVKYDGSCCMIKTVDGVIEFYKRFDAKKGRKIPAGAIPCQEEADPVTGHWPHWLKITAEEPSNKHFISAYNYGVFTMSGIIEDGTYEAIGKHFNGNPYNIDYDYILKHGEHHIHDLTMTYDGIRKWLKINDEEGIVFWKNGCPICKIKRSDFGFEWPVKIGDSN